MNEKEKNDISLESSKETKTGITDREQNLQKQIIRASFVFTFAAIIILIYSVINDWYIHTDTLNLVAVFILIGLIILYMIDIRYTSFRFNSVEESIENITFKTYFQHAVIIFFLPFSLTLFSSMEVVTLENFKQSKAQIVLSEDVSKNKLFSEFYTIKDFIESKQAIDQNSDDNLMKKIINDNAKPILVMSNIEEKEQDIWLVVFLYVSYAIFQSVLITIIAIEFTTIYFVRNHSEKGLVESLLIASILDIAAFTGLKAVIAQPSLLLEVPKYDYDVGLLFIIASLLSFFSSFGAIHIAQVKIDRSLIKDPK